MQNKTENQLNAGFFVRLAAYAIDYILINTALWLIRLPIWISSLLNPGNILVKDLIFKYSISDIFIYVLTASYFVFLTYKSGATVGKKMMHLRVVSVEDREVTLLEVIYRETIGRFLSALILGVGYIMVGVSEQKRGLHDRLSDTQVIYYHEKTVHQDTIIYEKEENEEEYVTPSYLEMYAKNENPIEEILTEEILEEQKDQSV